MDEGVITFNRPYVSGAEFDYMRDAAARAHLSGDGFYTRACQTVLEELIGAAKVLLTTSCTHALDLAALLLDIGPADEFLVSPFTFVSTANAFVLRGARPVFVDIRPDTLNLDETLAAARISSRTRALVVTHYAGVGCEMEELGAIAARKGLSIVEDNAHGLFGRYRGRPLGSFGRLAAQSFHETKNISCGEGGALVVNDPTLIERAEIIREKGTNRTRFFRREVDKYTWLDLGSSYLPSDLLAAFLWAQLEQREAIQDARRRIWQGYRDGLAEWSASTGARLPYVPAHCEQPYHLFYLVLPTVEDRSSLMAHLADRRIASVFHYVPLHTSPMGRRLGGAEARCPVAEEISSRLLRLPFYTAMSTEDQARVIDAINAWRPQ
jgi:dTDP-4-amino-4,6-dideoxygalactose transaminase